MLVASSWFDERVLHGVEQESLDEEGISFGSAETESLLHSITAGLNAHDKF